MKKFILSLTVMMVTLLTSANAMSYEQAREQALFLTDKMAYELNLNDAQYEAAYEINLDYLMGVNTVDDLYAAGWTRRSLDLSYILLDWQYRLFCDAAYFFRPLTWSAGAWHFAIYTRYPHRHHFYFGCPIFYNTYRGGHAWHVNGGASWYHHNFHGHVHAAGVTHTGMRDSWNRGSYNHGKPGSTHGSSNGFSGRTVHGSSNNAGSSRQLNPSNRSVNHSGFSGRTENNDHGAASQGISSSRYPRQSSTRQTVERRQEQTVTPQRREIGSSASSNTTMRQSSTGMSTNTHSRNVTGSSVSTSRGSHSSSGSSFGSGSHGGGNFSGASHSGGSSRGSGSNGGGARFSGRH